MSGTTYHCSGVLVEADSGETLGMHSNAYKLRDEAGQVHVLYAAHGRGADGQCRAQAQHAGMHIGQRYHASGTMFRKGATMCFYFGRIQIAQDQRRQHVPAVGSEVRA